MNVRYLSEALAEYEAAAKWYDDHSPGAGDDFVEAIAVSRDGVCAGDARITGNSR